VGPVRLPLAEGQVGIAAIPVAELRIKDTWHTTGMRATGSNLVEGQDVFVPDHRVLNLGEAITGSSLIASVLTYMIGPYLGTAQAALDHVVAQAGKRPVTFTTYQRQSDSPSFQIAIAEATAKIDVARLLARSCAEVLDGPLDHQARARHRLHAAHAVQQCGAAVDQLVAAHGASAVAESSPLNVFMRDMQTAQRHAMINPAWNMEACGRAFLGVEPNIVPFF
jgi:3-hydroxy-9,10-secoandrosta-1,3,5(10)-triene-9,17-dione monooxygenase